MCKLSFKKTKHILVMSNRETCHSDDLGCKLFVNNVVLENMHTLYDVQPLELR